MIRFLDIIFSLTGLIFLSPVLFLIYFICLFDTGSPLFFQERVGINLKTFMLIKFRTMKLDTKSIATHLVDRSKITFTGNLLRFTKLDELPQLWNVLVGDMSIVGPRPCLKIQKKLIEERKKKKLFKFRPGITGTAQLNGFDMSNPVILAKIDFELMKNFSLSLYLLLILRTILKSITK